MWCGLGKGDKCEFDSDSVMIFTDDDDDKPGVRNEIPMYRKRKAHDDINSFKSKKRRCSTKEEEESLSEFNLEGYPVFEENLTKKTLCNR